MHIELASEPGTNGRPNEDLALVTPEAVVVLDGVTPHPDGSGCVHGVCWYVARLGNALLSEMTLRVDEPLERCLGTAIERTAAAHGGQCELSHPRTPQSTVVATRLSEQELEYLVLSDSTLLLDTEHGPRVVTDGSPQRLPEPVPSLRARVRALPDGTPERERARADYVRAVEGFRNAPGGFHTAAADPTAAGQASTGALPLSAVRGFAALTDGATRLVEVFRTVGWEETLSRLASDGPDALLADVRKAELADPDGVAVPRGKPYDDATAVWARLTGHSSRSTTEPIRNSAPG